MTREEAKVAILELWNKLPVWKRRNTSDATEFTHIMLTSRPDLTGFECPFDRFLVVRAWLVAEQQLGKPGGFKRKGEKKPAPQLKDEP